MKKNSYVKSVVMFMKAKQLLSTARNVKLLHPNSPKCAATVPGLLNIS